MSANIKLSLMVPQYPFFAFFLAVCDTASPGTAGCPLPSISIYVTSSLAPILAPALVGFALLVAVIYYDWRRHVMKSSAVRYDL